MLNPLRGYRQLSYLRNVFRSSSQCEKSVLSMEKMEKNAPSWAQESLLTLCHWHKILSACSKQHSRGQISSPNRCIGHDVGTLRKSSFDGFRGIDWRILFDLTLQSSRYSESKMHLDLGVREVKSVVNWSLAFSQVVVESARGWCLGIYRRIGRRWKFYLEFNSDAILFATMQ